MNTGVTTALVIGVLFVGSCAPAAPSSLGGAQQQPPPGAGRTLVMISGAAVPTFSGKPILSTGSVDTRAVNVKHVLNATLDDLDAQGLPTPFLAEALPELSAATWELLPDGRMETSYRLRPNLTWHDGQPLVADDFVFAFRVYKTTDFGVATSGALRYMEDVTARDQRSFVIRWNQLYADATGVGYDLQPLPRHILEQPLQQLAAEPFMGLPFWTSDYVGAGPWKLERNEPGAFFEASAFDGFVFGRPRIDRVKMVYINDVNTVVANLLAGEGHYSIEGTLTGDVGDALEQGWATTKAGVVSWEPNAGQSLEIQQRPELAVPVQLATDRRVRQALAYAADKAAMSEAVTSGHGLVREIYAHPSADYYETVLRGGATTYPYDLRRAQQRLEEAEFVRGSDGGWVTPTGERFTLDTWYLESTVNQRSNLILVDGLRRFGIDASSNQWGAQRTSAEERAKVTGAFQGQQNNLLNYHSSNIARAENRWTGVNRYGFSRPDMDHVLDVYQTTMSRSDRIPLIAQMERIASEQLPGIPMYWTPKVLAYTAKLNGVVPPKTPEAVNRGRSIWGLEWAA